MIQILSKIKNLSLQEKKSLEQIGLKLTEETGECCQALLSAFNANGCGYKKFTTDDVKEECVDLILVALSLFYKLNGNTEELLNVTESKMKKWQEKSSKQGE